MPSCFYSSASTGTASVYFDATATSTGTATTDYFTIPYSDASTDWTEWNNDNIVYPIPSNIIYHPKPWTHTPDKFIYEPGEEIEEFGLTQRLAPIDEALEIEGAKHVLQHLERMLNDEAYRKQQLDYLNSVNKAQGKQEVIFDPNPILTKIAEIKRAYSPINMWRSKAKEWMEQNAKENAERLFNEVFTPEEVMRMETDKKLIISRNNLTFELLADGKINQLLPNGEKQGWCLIAKGLSLPLHDVLIMKKLLLESAPEIVLATANKL